MVRTPFDPSLEWEGFATDTFRALGAHPGEPADDAPSVASSVPAPDATAPNASNLTITFDEPVAVNGSWFSIECSVSGSHAADVGGGPTEYTLDPLVDFVTDESCEVTIFAAGVTDTDLVDPPDAMGTDHSFTFGIGTSCPAATHLIHEVQGTGLTTPISGTTVTVNAIVVG